MAQAPGTVVEHLSEGLLIVDPTAKLIYWNPAALRMYGFASSEDAIRSLADAPKLFELTTLEGVVIPPEEWPLARVLRGESLCDLELTIRRFSPAWTRVFRYSGSRVHYAGRRSLGFLTVNDVTERKQTEKELERVSRLNVARSLINQAIVRTSGSRQPVPAGVPDTGGEGRLRAWSGSAGTRPRTQRLMPVAQWGDETGYLGGVEIYADDRPGGRGPERAGIPTRQAVRLQRCFR